MSMLKRIARLFTIKTRTEAYLVTYAIAVGAMERGMHYMETYPGTFGILLAIACAGVPMIAGAKLLDAVRPVHAPMAAAVLAPPRRHDINRTRPRSRPTRSASVSRRSLHKD